MALDLQRNVWKKSKLQMIAEGYHKKNECTESTSVSGTLYKAQEGVLGIQVIRKK